MPSWSAKADHPRVSVFLFVTAKKEKRESSAFAEDDESVNVS
jgi:hypothetical protein